MKMKSLLTELYRNKSLYSMALPGLVLILLFSYLPLFGLMVAFKDFNFKDGIWGSPWIEPFYGNFKFLFAPGSTAMRATLNTLYLNSLFIVFGIIFQIGLALLFNELAGKYFKKITQSLMFLPYFISWIVVGVIAYNLFNTDTGVINSLLKSMGLNPFEWFTTPWVWPILLVLFHIWKSTGYGMVLYLASLTGIDPSYYEAAKIDGATKWQQIRYISLPFLMPTILTLTLLQAGRIMNADFGMFYAIVGENAAIYNTADVIDTFIFRSLRLNGDIGMASAAGFYQSVLSFAIIMLCNKLARRLDEDSSLF
ncbi:ABC transporter permease [Paenibacillus sp. HW567]|uniref:ABC transporter permease n=1 Tax=Paenibacillus sp. HW567 TaxID=1034769 RepID=UPI0003668E38|nr:ABC transporter permease subunit [Paenibacillus sp. HW567]